VNAELVEKRRRLHALLDAEGLDAIVLRKPGSVAWYSGGGRTHVVATPELGVADVVVRRDGDEVVTTVNEAGRMEHEELTALGARFRVLPWAGDRDAELPAHGAGTDSPFGDARDLADALEAARRGLTDAECDRYRALGRDAAAALTEAALAFEPAQTEQLAAATVAESLLARGADATVLLVAGEERLPHHRHPLPTDARLGRLVMVVVCARRHGLVASLTRLVAFGPLRPELREAYERLLHVDTAFAHATVPGRSVGDAFGAGAAAYAAHGFDADEWQLHHQGGPTGYEPRDYLATADATATIEAGQAFAWNPSAPSIKSEDTILAWAGGPEVLTADPAWPSVLVDGLVRPLVLER
jgi:Xaa-Pro aminopeptidase